MILWLENLWVGLKCFLLFPIFSLFPPPLPYLLSRYLSRLEYRYHPARRESIRRGMAQFLEGVHSLRGGLDLAVRRYFEVIFCDEIDPFIYLLGFSRRFIRGIRIEGEENLKEALRNRGGDSSVSPLRWRFLDPPFTKGERDPYSFFCR